MPFAWQPGHRITAGRLRAGMLAGTAVLDFSTGTTVTAGSSPFDVDVLRKSVAVAFPVGFFATVPAIILTAESTVPGVLLEVTYSGQSTSGFTLNGCRQTDAATTVSWLAVEII